MTWTQRRQWAMVVALLLLADCISPVHAAADVTDSIKNNEKMQKYELDESGNSLVRVKSNDDTDLDPKYRNGDSDESTNEMGSKSATHSTGMISLPAKEEETKNNDDNDKMQKYELDESGNSLVRVKSNDNTDLDPKYRNGGSDESPSDNNTSSKPAMHSTGMISLSMTPPPAKEEEEEEEETGNDGDESDASTTATAVTSTNSNSKKGGPVDFETCLGFIQLADELGNSNHLMTQDEYIMYLNHMLEYVSTDYDNQLPPFSANYTALPKLLQFNFVDFVHRAGIIDVEAYDREMEQDIAHQLFLLRFCVQTEDVLRQIIDPDHYQTEADQEPPDTVESSPFTPEHQYIQWQVVVVYSSFVLSNEVGILAKDLTEERLNRKRLEQAYHNMVHRVVVQQGGTRRLRMLRDSTATMASDRDDLSPTQRRRNLRISLNTRDSLLYRVEDTPCPGKKDNNMMLATEWCQNVYGRYLLLLSGTKEDPDQVYTQYAGATQDATNQGDLQAALRVVHPRADVRVLGTAPLRVPADSKILRTVYDENSPLSPQALNTVPSDAARKPPDVMRHWFTLVILALLLNTTLIIIALFTCWNNNKEQEAAWAAVDYKRKDAPTLEEIQAMMDHPEPLALTAGPHHVEDPKLLALADVPHNQQSHLLALTDAPRDQQGLALSPRTAAPHGQQHLALSSVPQSLALASTTSPGRSLVPGQARAEDLHSLALTESSGSPQDWQSAMALPPSSSTTDSALVKK